MFLHIFNWVEFLFCFIVNNNVWARNSLLISEWRALAFVCMSHFFVKVTGLDCAVSLLFVVLILFWNLVLVHRCSILCMSLQSYEFHIVSWNILSVRHIVVDVNVIIIVYNNLLRQFLGTTANLALFLLLLKHS